MNLWIFMGAPASLPGKGVQRFARLTGGLDCRKGQLDGVWQLSLGNTFEALHFLREICTGCVGIRANQCCY